MWHKNCGQNMNYVQIKRWIYKFTPLKIFHFLISAHRFKENNNNNYNNNKAGAAITVGSTCTSCCFKPHIACIGMYTYAPSCVNYWVLYYTGALIDLTVTPYFLYCYIHMHTIRKNANNIKKATLENKILDTHVGQYRYR